MAIKTFVTDSKTNSSNIFTVGDNNVTVYAGSGYQTVRIQSGVTGVTLDANVERVELSQKLSSYRFASTSSGFQIYSLDNAVVAIIPNINETVKIAFADGSSTLVQTGTNTFSLGTTATTGLANVPEIAGLVTVKLSTATDDFSTLISVAKNNPPTADPIQSVKVDEDKLLKVVVLASDSDNDSLSYSIDLKDNLPKNGTVEKGVNNDFTYTPNQNFSGVDSFSVNVSDAKGGISTQKINITVNPINDAPTGAVSIKGIAIKDSVLEASNNLSDVDGLGKINYQWLADGKVISGATDSLFKITADQVNKTISVQANYTDLQGFSNSVLSEKTALVSTTASNLAGNHSPVVSPEQSVRLDEDKSLKISITATDEDKDTLAYTVNTTNNITTANSSSVGTTTAGKAYYISPTGNDSNTGTKDSPFSSVDAANKLVQAGDTVYFLDGVYRNSTYGDGNIWKDGLDVIMRIKDVHGTEEQPITYSPAPGAKVTLQYDGNGAVRLQNATYIKLQGFDIQGPAGKMTLQQALDNQFAYRVDANKNGSVMDDVTQYRDPSATLTKSISQLGGIIPTYFNSNAIAINSGSNHIQIVDNSIHDSPGHAIASMGGADYVTVKNNIIYDNVKYTSSGNHAISFKGVTSSDTNDGIKIIVEGNKLTDNYNLLVSWSQEKKDPVTMAIDEGKGIHFQNVNAASGFDHGQILVSNNIVVRSGNAGITANDVERITIENNTLVDNGYLNTLMAAGKADPKVEKGFEVNAGGIRLSGGSNITVTNNLITTSQSVLNPLDSTANTTGTFSNNLYVGSNPPYSRSADKSVALGFTQIQDAGFVNAQQGNYNLLATSPAINAGATVALASDFAGTVRSDGKIDVGAFEYSTAPKTVGAAEHGTVVKSGTSDFIYTPDANFSGSDSFVVTVADGKGGESNQLVKVTVNAVNDKPTGTISIQGNVIEGNVIEAVNNLTDIDGMSGNISYQWLANGIAISGATDSSFKLTQAQVNKTISLKASYVDLQGFTNDVLSEKTSSVTGIPSKAAPVIKNPTAPTIISLTDDLNTLVSKGGITTDATPTLKIEATTGNTVNVFDNGVLLGTAKEKETLGTFTFTSDKLLVGSHSLTAKSIDLLSNQSADSATYSFSIGVASEKNGSAVTLTVEGKNDLADNSFKLVAAGYPKGSSVLYQVSKYDAATGKNTWENIKNGDVSGLVDGDYQFRAKIKDSKNVVLNTTDILSVTVNSKVKAIVADTKAPDKAIITDINGIDTQLILTIKAEAGSTVRIFDSTALLGEAVETNVSGVFIFKPSNTLATGNHSFYAKATDASNNSGLISDPYDFAIMGNAPVIQSMLTDSSKKTVTLIYDKALDASNLPDTTQFEAITLGAKNTVSTISVNGNVMTLTLTDNFHSGAFSLRYNDKTVANDVKAIQDKNGIDASGFVQGIVADGYIRGAQIYIDTGNNNLVMQTGVITDSHGNFFLPSDAPKGTIVAVGGFNIDTGLPNTMLMKAPSGSILINPLTTLVQAIVDNANMTSIEAAAIVAKNMGILLPSGQSLLTYDPLGNNDVSVQKISTMVSSVVEIAARGDNTIANTVIKNLAEVIVTNSNFINLNDADTLLSVLKNIDSSVLGERNLTLADVISKLDTATNLTEISAIQSIYVDNVSPIAPTSLQVASRVNNAKPDIRINLNVAAQDGSATVAGDRVSLWERDAQVAMPITLTEENIKAGFVTVSTYPLIEGLHTFSSTITDRAGNRSDLSTSAKTFIDLTSPTAILTSDSINLDKGGQTTLFVTFNEAVTGFTKDNISVSNGKLGNLSQPEVLSTGEVRYSIGYTAPTTTGTSTVSFSGNYADLVGNSGKSVTPLEIKTTTSLSSFSAGILQLTNKNDFFDNTFNLVLSGQEAGAAVSYQVSKDGGKTWSQTMSMQTAIPVGDYQFRATVTNADETLSKNTAVVSASVADSIAPSIKTPAIPVITSAYGDSRPAYTGPIANNALSTEPNPTLTIKADSGKDVWIYQNGVMLGKAQEGSQKGTYTYKVDPYSMQSVWNGDNLFTAKASDNLGNTSASSETYKITKGNFSPNSPYSLIYGVTDFDYSGDDRNFTLTVTGVPKGMTAEWQRGDITGKNWVATPTSVFMDYNTKATFSLKIKDATNKVVYTSSSFSVSILEKGYGKKVDAITPDKPTIVDINDDIGAMTGILNWGATTDDARPTLTIHAESGAQMRIFDGATLLGFATESVTKGTFNYTPMSDLTVGAHNFYARVTDSYMNTSLDSSPYKLNVVSIATVSADKTAPVSPAEVALIKEDGNQLSSSDSNALPKFQIKAEVGSTVRVYDDTALLGIATQTQTPGTYVFNVSKALKEGLHNINVKAVDVAGNESVATTFMLTVDTLPPSSGTLILLDKADNADNTFTLKHSGYELGALTQLQISNNGGSTWTNTTESQTILTNDTYLYRAVVTDKVGNINYTPELNVIVNHNYGVDTTKPVFTSEAEKKINYIPVTQVIYNASTTDENGSGNVSYKLKPVDDYLLFSIESSTGNITLPGKPAFDRSGVYNFTVIAQDTAGNIAEKSVKLGLNAANVYGEPVVGGSLRAITTDINGASAVAGGSTGYVESSIQRIEEHAGASYRWFADGKLIDGVTTSQIGITNDLAGKSISFEVTYKDGVTRELKTVLSGATPPISDYVAVSENSTGTVYQAKSAFDSKAKIWSLGGADADKFNVNSSGEITFKSSPDQEKWADADHNNRYDLQITQSDGVQSNTIPVCVQVNDVNNKISLSDLNSNVTLGKSTTPQLIDSQVTFTSSENLTNGKLVVSGLLLEDRVSILNSGNNINQIGFDSKTGAVSFGGVLIGSATGGIGNAFTVKFNENATSMAVDGLIESLTYANASTGNPTTTRNLSINIIDAHGINLLTVQNFTELTGSSNPFGNLKVDGLSAPTFGDIDGDGDLDMVTGSKSGEFFTFKNTGNGFVAWTDSTNPFLGLKSTTSGKASPELIDLSGNGTLDLVFSDEFGRIRTFRKTDGVYKLLPENLNPIDVTYYCKFRPGSFVDIDNNGSIDYVGGNYFGDFNIYKNQDGKIQVNFFSDTALPTTYASGVWSASAFTDLNNDGFLDVVAGSSNGDFSVWLNNDGQWKSLTQLKGASNPLNGFDVGNLSIPEFVDLYGNGDLYLISGREDGGFSAYKRPAGTAPTVKLTIGSNPTVSISTNDDVLKTGETAMLTFNLSQPSSNFTQDDISFFGGVLSNFKGSGASYSATFTPTSNSTTPAVISVSSNKFTDVAGNQNTSSASLNLAVDTTSKSVAVSPERQAFDLINRFRADPQGELSRMLGVSQQTLASKIKASTIATDADPSTATPEMGNGTAWSSNFWTTLAGSDNKTAIAMDGFKVNPGDLLYQWNHLPITGTLAPYAWNDNLGKSATAYAGYVVKDAGQTSNPHTVSPYTTFNFDRYLATGYSNVATVGENIAPNFEIVDAAYIHSGYVIDWGNTADGIQTPAGHRANMLNSTFTEAGIGIAAGWADVNNVTQVQHFGDRANTASEYVWGYAYQDAGLGAYKYGEGLQGLTVQILNSANTILSTTTTDANGGYTMPVEKIANGDYKISLLNGANVLKSNTVTLTDAGMYNSNFVIVDGTAPTVKITSMMNNATKTAVITFTLSEPSVGFAKNDIGVFGGTLGDLTGSGTVYNALFTPAVSNSLAIINIASGAFSDAAGNTNIDASLTIDLTGVTSIT